MHGVPCRCRIVPPYVLENIARNGSPEQRAGAAEALAHDTIVRTRRTAHTHHARKGQAQAPHVPGQPRRTIYDAGHAQTDPPPGQVVREEGAPAVSDVAVNEAYDGLGATYDLYWAAFQRDSIDGHGMELDAYVHYGENYGNAFWDGREMIFGDGDGQFIGLTTKSIDVIGHELTHGVTAATANLEYKGQSGALNESVSDVFGSLVKQRSLGQTAAEADWLIGADLLVPGVKGVALRSMKAPGTAYDDPVIGKDPQPATMAGYVHTTSDDGGVHTNSGIPNHAFYLVATAIGGPAWETAGHIWYETLTASGLASSANFAVFAAATLATAGRLFGADGKEAGAVREAWSTVGVTAA
jgi:Zn-dependent metalloprotease